MRKSVALFWFFNWVYCSDLPGLNFNVNFNHYSGFVNASDTKFLFFWMFESENDPQKDPFILWLNGGPGCSSLQGALMENGPFRLSSNGSVLSKNENSWTKFANILYLESPVHTGYSYSSTNETTTDDHTTGKENLLALVNFFNAYPNYRANDFYIMGESYAGYYVPVLASLILEQNDYPINLKGIAIGNGVVVDGWDSVFSPFYAHSIGLLGKAKFESFQSRCCENMAPTSCATSKECIELSQNITMDIPGVDPYDMSLHCLDFLDEVKAENISCFNDVSFEEYMNKEDVRKTLNIPHNLEWKVCKSLADHLGKPYNESTFTSMEPFIRYILSKQVRVLYFYGDTDMVCNHLSGEYFTAKVGGAPLVDSKSWLFNNKIGGKKTVYNNGLTYTTIHGAGHMAPQWKAEETSYVAKSFVQNTEF
ncbi:unnamed protein product [Bursaphelenchus okinawaensis]|uniref:Carboxypeptidase n=1 Tax=Bursaphelenchus okinawaensis TaxID=465554 RepID=A0A811KA27_9BILA|nr:unnamed protein product [Bursaphelenchus okinawaensis]CAG9095621.1 unnamed protein product [Bursaphelenchus okinawaensis]